MASPATSTTQPLHPSFIYEFNNGCYIGKHGTLMDVFVPKPSGKHPLATAPTIVKRHPLSFDVDFNSFENVGMDFSVHAEDKSFWMENGEIITLDEIERGVKIQPPPSWFDGLPTPRHSIVFKANDVSRAQEKQYWAQYGDALVQQQNPVGAWTFLTESRLSLARGIDNIPELMKQIEAEQPAALRKAVWGHATRPWSI